MARLKAAGRWLAAASLLLVSSGAAEAHGALQGIGDFYAGLLHPLIVPAEAMALVATGLLLGTAGRDASRAGLPVLLAGILIAMVVSRAASAPQVPETLPLIPALLAAGLVVSGLRAPSAALTSLVALSGIAVGLDAQPDAGGLPAFLTATAGTALGSVMAVTLIAALIVGRDAPWLRIGVRIAASWTMTVAILHLAWSLTGWTK